MAHHRQEETLRAVRALSKVDFGCETEIVVSDNPDSPEKVIKNLPPHIVHRVRNPPGESLWHANKIIQEIDHEWTLLTHDDDEMLPHLGDLFQQHYLDPEVMMITGKSRIISNGVEVQDKGYLSRLERAGLIAPAPVSRTDLFDALFDIGPLFPASAMIVRTEFLSSRVALNLDFDLAGDLAHSMALAYNSKIIFDSSACVMNYHLHGGNSVSTARAAGGLMADFTIVRLSEAVRHNLTITNSRRRMLIKAVVVSRILAKAFHLDGRYNNLRTYVTEFNKKFPKSKVFDICLIPLPLGPLKIVIRRLMWRRLGVKRWDY
jgi:hypothetical protein